MSDMEKGLPWISFLKENKHIEVAKNMIPSTSGGNLSSGISKQSISQMHHSVPIEEELFLFLTSSLS
jgi:hypothetical protein